MILPCTMCCYCTSYNNYAHKQHCDRQYILSHYNFNLVPKYMHSGTINIAETLGTVECVLIKRVSLNTEMFYSYIPVCTACDTCIGAIITKYNIELKLVDAHQNNIEILPVGIHIGVSYTCYLLVGH